MQKTVFFYFLIDFGLDLEVMLDAFLNEISAQLFGIFSDVLFL